MTNKVLIITHKEDYTADFLIHKLNERGLAYVRLNCEDLWSKNFKIENSFQFELEGISDFSSVWFRRTKLPKIESENPEIINYLLNEYDTFLKNLFAILDTRWLSNPYAIYNAENKLLQLKQAAKIGFKIPQTIVTSSKIALEKFYNDNNKKIIVKPLSQSRIYSNNSMSFLFTNLVKEEHLLNLQEFDLTPCIFQEYIEKKVELRVTVVGSNVYTAAVDSQKFELTKIDWRRENLKFFKAELPSELKNQCIALVKTLGLQFGAIDLILDHNGLYTFLEINPNGQWAWIESQTNLPISESIIKYLYL